ncbi:Uncharacterized conserved protein [Legionella busanensis]|uniref:Uncharacterized conserved protein n=1 Tax=Legionella busanensis TaxID=190655 RepID=A0A378K8S0_9GAMM|nr:hypothetical protein [Legionella busanensis]STX81338.1 Uncharacterized conserved protein [Legionella busanensis]
MEYPKLKSITAYKNDKVTLRYCKDYPNTKMHSEEALKELMKFIWLCLKHNSDKEKNPYNPLLNFSCTIHQEMADIDNIWHTFLLFTRDYQNFCDQYLRGNFFHHEPITSKIKLNKNYEQELTLYLSYIYDNLGKSTLLKWFR